jgi:hypothetical protein
MVHLKFLHFLQNLKRKIIYLHKSFKNFTHFSKEGDLTHSPREPSKRDNTIWISLVLLFDKQTLCCGTIRNTDQHLYRIKNFKNIIFHYYIHQRISRIKPVVKPRNIAILKPIICINSINNFYKYKKKGYSVSCLFNLTKQQRQGRYKTTWNFNQGIFKKLGGFLTESN